MKKNELTAIEDALAQILRKVSVVSKTENIALHEAAGRVVADNIKAAINVPGYDNSAMDGFAVNTEFVKEAGVSLPISQIIPAGISGETLKPGTSARIFTGAPIPDGADAVILQEDTDYDTQQVTIKEVPEAGQNIRLCGHDIKQGNIIFEQGHKLMPQDIGLLASLGIDQLDVFTRLKVAIVNTGDELVTPGKQLKLGQIYESNSYTLAALLNSLRLQVQKLGIVKDDREATEKALQQAAEEADCIISSGGVSVGEADFVKEAVNKLGELSLWKLAIKPGKPFSFGRVGDTPFFGLPGNPVAVFVTFLMLVKPYLLKMQGAKNIYPPIYRIAAGFDHTEPGSRQEYIRVRLQQNENKQELVPFPNQGSSVMTSTSWADGLAIIPINTQVKKGDLLDFLPFTGLL
jgi:molybdopterin molybdotransferase